MNDISPERTEGPEQAEPAQQSEPAELTEEDRTEQALREALGTLAGGVHADPDAYRTARGDWLRRERRRRLALVVLIAVVFTLTTLFGLWVLNQAPSDPDVVFWTRTPGPAT